MLLAAHRFGKRLLGLGPAEGHSTGSVTVMETASRTPLPRRVAASSMRQATSKGSGGHL